MIDIESLKRQAAVRAMDYVTSQSCIGLGSGTTMRYALEELGQRLATGRLHSVVGVPSSEQTKQLAQEYAIPLASLEECPELDVAIDGADEIDPHLNLIKGRGGALLREKIVAASARRFIIIADDTKIVTQLGSRVALPVEVIPFAMPLVLRQLAKMGGTASIRQATNGQPFWTDEGNHIVDYACGPIHDPAALAAALHRIPGIVEHGLFLGMAQRAIIANREGIRLLERADEEHQD